MSTLITWFWWCLLIFSTVTLLFFPVSLGGNTLSCTNILSFLILCLSSLATLIVLAWNCYSYCDFFISLTASTFINWNSSVRKSCLFPPFIYLFICLFTSVWTHECLFCFMGYNPILLIFILLLKFTSLFTHLNNEYWLYWLMCQALFRAFTYM